jgi:hypothetical protein
MSIPFYCRRCEEMLANGQDQCPFCDNPNPTPIDELIDEGASELGRLGMFSHAKAIVLAAETLRYKGSDETPRVPRSHTKRKPNVEPDEVGCWYGVERCTLPHCDCNELSARVA